MMERDLATGIVAAGFALLAYEQAGRFAQGGVSLSENPAVYPRMLALVVFAIGLTLIARAIIASARSRGAKQAEVATNSTGKWRIAVTIGLLAAYVWAIHLLGFVIPTLAFTLATPMSLGARFKTALFLGVPLTLAIYLVFFTFFKVPPPSGILLQ